jgi:HAMP domain-containing protein
MKPEHEYKQTFNPWCDCATCKNAAKHLHEKHLGKDAEIARLRQHSDNQHKIHQSVTGHMQDEIDRLRAQVETLTRELAAAKRCPTCNGKGQAMLWVGCDAVNGEWVDRMEEDECPGCEGTGCDR